MGAPDESEGCHVQSRGDHDEYETDPDKPPAHSPAPQFGIFIMTRDVALIHVKRLYHLRV